MYPQTKEESGTHYWHILFNTAAQFPDNASRDKKLETTDFIRKIISNFTCQACIHHAFDYMAANPIDLSGKEALMKWMCGLKNNANLNAGKGQIDCSDFVKNNLSKDGGCKSCAIVPDTPIVNLPEPIQPKQITVTTIPKEKEAIAVVKADPSFESVWDWQNRYPSLKRSFQITPGVTETTTVQTQVEPSMTDLSERYPSLQGFDNPVPVQQEEFDGVLKPLDGIYQFPANLVDIKSHEFNLAYTPEMVANLSSLISQMYLTNFGSLLTTMIGGLGLFGVSILAKNSLSHYDRLFMQNVVASLLFHSLNFINPRIKDEVLPAAQRFVEGVTTMNFEKVKGAVLYNYDNSNSTASPEELMAMMEAGAIVDMDRLKVPKMSYMGGPGHSFASSSVREAQNASQGAFDSRLSGVNPMGSGIGNSVSPTKDVLERMYNERSKYNSGSMNDFTFRRTMGNPDMGMLGSVDDKYSYILDNNIL